MRRWRIEKLDDYIIMPTMDFKCPFCGHRLYLHAFHASGPSYGFYHCDVHMKCPNCSGFFTFGVPISKDEFLLLSKSKYNHHIFSKDITLLYGDEVKDRLESWGYW